MELATKPFYVSLKRYWRRRRYQRLKGARTTTSRKNVKITRFRGSSSSRCRLWRIKALPKLRLKISSPLKLVWRKLKNGYVEMMVNLAGKVGYVNDENYFVGKGISKAGQGSVVYSSEEVENRVVYEIYKALVANGQLSAILYQSE